MSHLGVRGLRTLCPNKKSAKCERYHNRIISQFQDEIFVILLLWLKIMETSKIDLGERLLLKRPKRQ